MKKTYRFSPLSKDEKEYLEMIMMEEMDVQAWYAVTFITMFDEEVFVCLQ